MKRRGFTLIELLVVIAIIAILAAILFPVFAQAREKARQITCASNEKEIGLAILQYVQDYDESYPIAWDNTGVNGGLTWPVLVQPYIKNGLGAQLYAGAEVGGVWSCPDYPGQTNAPPGASPTYDQYRALNDVIDDTFWASNAAPPHNQAMPTNLNEIASPAQKIMVFESRNQGNCNGWPPNPGDATLDTAQWHWASANQNPKGAVADIADMHAFDAHGTGWMGGAPDTCWGTYANNYVYRHGGNTQNITFCDGHVKAMHKGQVSYVNNVLNFPSRHDNIAPF